MTEDFEVIFSCFVVIFFAVMFYLADKGDFLTVVPKIFLDRLEKINKENDNLKHGIWQRSDEKGVYWCTCCGRLFHCDVDMNGLVNYCSNCGAKMDGMKEGD